MLYNVKMIKSVLKQTVLFAIVNILILASGIFFALRVGLDESEIGGCAILIGTMVICIFMLGNFTMPCIHYYRYLDELMTGRNTVRRGCVMTVSKDAVYKDNKNYYYEVDVKFEDGKCGMYLYDANFGKPELNEGDGVEIVSYENFILKVTEL